MIEVVRIIQTKKLHRSNTSAAHSFGGSRYRGTAGKFFGVTSGKYRRHKTLNNRGLYSASLRKICNPTLIISAAIASAQNAKLIINTKYKQISTSAYKGIASAPRGKTGRVKDLSMWIMLSLLILKHWTRRMAVRSIAPTIITSAHSDKGVSL